MIPNKIIVSLVIFSLVVGLTGYYMYQAGADAVRADMSVEIQNAVKKARKEELVKQEKVNELAQTQYNELSIINDNLNTNLSRLRNRPSRRSVSDNTEAKCKGSTGSDLSAPDAEFLTRLAARADTLRAALKTCYDYADTLNPKGD